MIWIREDSFYDLATRGLLMDLGPFIAKDPDFDPNNFLPGVFESARVNGIQYAAALLRMGADRYYNRTWFQQAGLPDPQPGWDLLRVSRHRPTSFQL